LKDYALEELARCAADPNLRRGLKLHFGNSVVDFHNPEPHRVRGYDRTIANDRQVSVSCDGAARRVLLLTGGLLVRIQPEEPFLSTLRDRPLRFVNNREQFRSDFVDGPPQGAVDDLCVYVQRVCGEFQIPSILWISLAPPASISPETD
jgi:hypothetical protein